MKKLIEETLRAVCVPEAPAADLADVAAGMRIPRTGLGQLGRLGERLRAIYLSRPAPSVDVSGDHPAREAGGRGAAACAVKIPLRKLLIVAAADHGVARHGVTRYPQRTTAELVSDVLGGSAVVARIAPRLQVKAIVLDAGVVGEVRSGEAGWADLVGVGAAGATPHGTRDITEEPAMSREVALRSISAGIEALGRACAGWDVDLLGVGDLGLGSTVSACAMAAVLTGLPVGELVGAEDDAVDGASRGGLVQRAIERASPDPDDSVGILAEFGGLETGTLAGICIGAAARRIPVLLDGVVSAAAAAVAAGLAPAVRAYLIASHEAAIPAHRALLDRLGLDPLLRLGLNLGEGAGSVMAMGLVEAAWEIACPRVIEPRA